MTAGARRRLLLLDGRFAVCRLPPSAPWPAPAPGRLFSVTRTAEETSIVCASAQAPAGARVEDGWRAFQVEGPIPFQETGVLSALSGALAAAGLSVFAIATFDTDYVLVPESGLGDARAALEAAGFGVSG